MSRTDDREQPVPDDAPEADIAEQRADLGTEEPPADDPGADEEEARDWTAQLPFDADEADAADQRREIRLDEDDYR